MTDLIKKLICILLLSLFLAGCQSVKEGLSMKKKSNDADEFLIEKKSPLILPPDYNTLPVPAATGAENKETDINIKSMLKKKSSNKASSSTNPNKSLEKNILDKLKKLDVN